MADTRSGAQERAPASRRWAMLAALCASLLLVGMDATILNVALPSLIDDLRPTPLQQLWIIDVYGLVLGGLLITTSSVGDRLGRKRLFLIGFVLFGVASAASATADSPWQLIAGRALLGVGGAMVMPSTLSLIRNIFTDDKERALAIGIWTAVAGAGAAIGPLVGGLLIEAYGWTAAFWINVPVVVITVVAGIRLLPEVKHPHSGKLDWLSALLSVIGVVTLAWGIKSVFKGGLADPGAVVLAVSVLTLGWFARRQLGHPDPLLDVRLFKKRAFTAAALTTFLAMLAIGAALFLLSLWLQYVQNYSPFQAGLRTVPAAGAMIVSALVCSWLTERIGVRAVMALGLCGLVAGFSLLAIAPTPVSYGPVAIALVTFGIGDGLAITAAVSTLVAAVPERRAGQAGAVSESSYELGVALGVALLGSVHGAAYTTHMADWPPLARGSIGGAREFHDAYGGEVMDSARAAFDAALITTSYVSAGIMALLTVCVVLLMPRGFEAKAAH
ncbi:MFS transporter [Streptomyces sp. NPDC059175]|uniref:MFS transporter n=1 Tax=Streptomyces sp. NPDC059175 TaxID=3346757 RepID=UPI0036AA842C